MDAPTTVAVTGANSRVGRELLARLAERPVRTVALVRGPTDVPADEVITDWTSSPRAVTALTGADAVVHLCGEVNARDAAGYDAANVAPTRIVAGAARPGQRLLFISYPGADAASPNLFLRAKGRAEQLLRDTPADAFLFATQIIAHPLDAPGPFEDAIRRTRPGAAVRIIGDGRGVIRPIAQADVVAVLLAALDGRLPAGRWDLVGPDALTLDDVVRLHNGDRVPIVHVPGWLARSLSRVVPDLSPTFVDLFLRPTPAGDPGPLTRALGLRLTPLTSLWSRPATPAPQH